MSLALRGVVEAVWGRLVAGVNVVVTDLVSSRLVNWTRLVVMGVEKDILFGVFVH